MITLPTGVTARSVKASLLDFGFINRPSSGAPAQRYDRLGSRYSMEFELPPLPGDVARVVKARLTKAKRDGLRMPVPLMGGQQGSPGAAVVDGTDSVGTLLKLRGLTPGWFAREGFWLNVTDADGALYLHDIAEPVRAASDGTAELTLGIPLRCVLADGAAVRIANPVIEGLVTSEVGWSDPVGRIVSGIAFTVEELG
jgi:hypothetical protein